MSFPQSLVIDAAIWLLHRSNDELVFCLALIVLVIPIEIDSLNLDLRLSFDLSLSLDLSLGLGLSRTFSVSTSASRVALVPRRAGNAGFIVQRRAGGAADFEDLVTYNTFAPLKTKGVQVLSKTQ